MAYSIDLSGKILKDLDDFAKQHDISRSEAAIRAFAFLSISERERKKGNDLGVINISGKKSKVVRKISMA